MSDKVIICSHCGEENLSDATRCLYCGLPLEDAFSIQGVNNSDNTLDPIVRNLSTEPVQDLPEFLRQLRREYLETNIPDTLSDSDLSETNDKPSLENSKNKISEEKNADQDIPEWLNKVRQRINHEEDAAGELIKRVSARDDCLKEETTSGLEDEFDDWITQIRETARRDSSIEPKADLTDDNNTEDEIPGWLKRLREIETETTPGDDLDHTHTSWEESVLPVWIEKEGAEFSTTPDAVKNEISIGIEQTQPMGIQKKAEKENYSQIGDKKSQDQESTGSRIDQTGILIDKKIPSETKTQGGELKDLDIDNFISKEHREKIELLKSVLFEESKNLIIPSKPEKPKFNVFRLVLSLIIIIIISFPFFFGDGSEIISGNLDTGSQLLYDSLEALQPESDVLLVVDYYPGRSAEFEVIAYPILQHIFDKQVKLSILTTKIQGLWLAHKLLDSYGDYGEVDYIPGGVFGTLSYALRDSVLVENPIGKIDNEVSLTDPVNFERILLLVDSLQGAKKWLEQVQPFHKNIPLLILSSSQEDVMLQPYLETGQLHGLLSGYHNSAIYASHLNQPLKSSNSWRAYQAGLLLMAIIILVSFIVGGIKTDKKKLHNKKDVS